MATQAPSQGPLVAVLPGTGRRRRVGLINGIGVGIFRVQPLIMTLGTGLVVAGLLTVYQQFVHQRRVPRCLTQWPGSAAARRSGSSPTACCCSCPSRRSSSSGCDGPATAVCCIAVGRQPHRGAPGRRPRLAGPARRVRHLGRARGHRGHHVRGRHQDGRARRAPTRLCCHRWRPPSSAARPSSAAAAATRAASSAPSS